MLKVTKPIRPLSRDVVAQIKSAIVISSLCNVVIGLLNNSLDAGARNIDISVDFLRGACSVEDDGYGIPPNEFEDDGGLGKPYHTSKFNTENISHGMNGTFLSSVAALSILTITSHHYSYVSQSTLILHHSRPAARLAPAPLHHQLKCRDHGTRITVQDLFGNMPVRVKQRALEMKGYGGREREWDSVRRNITGALLAWHVPVSVSVRGPDKEQNLYFRTSSQGAGVLENDSESKKSGSFDLSLIRSVLIQGVQINPGDWNTWMKISAQTPFITIRALFSLQPSPSKLVQFISLGIQHISHENGFNVLYDEVNHLFASSSFGAQEELDITDGFGNDEKVKDRRFKHDGFTNKQLRGGGKGTDRWPMFYIRIELRSARASQAPKYRAVLEEGSTLTSIVDVLRTMIFTFLSEHHLRPRAKRWGKRATLSNAGDARDGQKLGSGRLTSIDIPKLSKNRCSQEPRYVSSTLSLSADGEPQRELRTIPSYHELGSKVNLPSFAQKNTSCRQDDFRTWSRVKSGARKPVSSLEDFIPLTRKLLREASLSDNPSSWKASKDTPALDSVGEHSLQVSPPIQLPNKFTSMGDKIKILPQAANEISQSRDTPCMPITDREESQFESRFNLYSHAKDDETISWTNPITKDTFLINSRTGMVVPRPLIPPSSSSSFSSSSSSCTGPAHLYPHSLRNGNSERWRTNRNENESFPRPKAGSWTDHFLQAWKNPVFRQNEESIPHISIDGPSIGTTNTSFGVEQSSSISIEKAFTELPLRISTKLGREGLENATVLAQVDGKFILLKMGTALTSPKEDDETSNDDQVLVLVDQHAADERIRIEALLIEMCAKPSREVTGVRSKTGFVSDVKTTRLEKAIVFHIKVQERCLFQRHASYFAKWGIIFDLSQPRPRHSLTEPEDWCQVTIHALPPGIAERCRVDVSELAKLMRGEVWKREEDTNSRSGCMEGSQSLTSEGCSMDDSFKESSSPPSWLDRIRDCPQGILDMLNSRSCRSAIMFNDMLTLGQCKTLIRKLSACQLPFQCAHGRPSMIPLVELGSSNTALHRLSFPLSAGSLDVECNEERTDFREAWRTWKTSDRDGMG